MISAPCQEQGGALHLPKAVPPLVRLPSKAFQLHISMASPTVHSSLSFLSGGPTCSHVQALSSEYPKQVHAPSQSVRSLKLPIRLSQSCTRPYLASIPIKPGHKTGACRPNKHQLTLQEHSRHNTQRAEGQQPRTTNLSFLLLLVLFVSH